MNRQHDFQGVGSARSKALGWMMQRITGAALVLFLGLHFWVQHMPTGFLATAEEYSEILRRLGETGPEFADAIAEGKIREALPGEHVITYDKVLERLRTPLWKLIDIMLLLFSLVHGMLGVVNVLGDYIRHSFLRKAAVTCGWTAVLFLAAQGIASIMAVGMN